MRLAQARTVRFLLALLSLIAAASASGCTGNATTNAAIAGISLAGVGIGVPLATHSQVQVQVDTFREDELSDQDRAKFCLTDSIIQRMVEQCCKKSADTTEGHANAASGQLPKSIEDFLARVDAQRANVDALKNLSDNARQFALQRDKGGGQATTGETRSLMQAATDAHDAVKSYQNLREAAAAEKERNSQAPVPDALLKDSASLKRQLGRISVSLSPAPATSQAFQLAAAATEVANGLPSGLAPLAGNNFGPIVDEVMQEVLSQSGAIDCMTNPKNQKYWSAVPNGATSFGGTGDHDAVIYFENMATPILKSSKFDPSKFVQAFGDMYRLAFYTAAGVLGVPGSGASGAAATSSGNTTFTDEQRTKDAESTRADAREAMLDALRSAIDANAPFKGGGGTDSDKQAAATALQDAARRLENLAAQ